MDHKWGDFVVGGGGWDWCAHQLDDGSELMISVRSTEGVATEVSYTTWIDPAGGATSLPIAEVDVRPVATWTSSRAGIEYPSGWRVKVERLGLDLEVDPVVADQELDVRQSTGNTYWGGAVRIADARSGRPAVGRGYVELTGYGAPRP